MASGPAKRKYTDVNPGSHNSGRDNPEAQAKRPTTTLKEFESVWPRIVADLEGHCKQYQLPQQSLDWFVKVYAFNPPRAPRLTLGSVAELQHCRWKM